MVSSREPEFLCASKTCIEVDDIHVFFPPLSRFAANHLSIGQRFHHVTISESRFWKSTETLLY